MYTFIIPVFDRWLLYAPLHGIKALVNTSAIEFLRNGSSSAGSGTLLELRETLQGKPKFVPVPPRGPLRPEFIGLIPTRACNFQCLYCGFGAAEAGEEVMDYSLAVSAVDWMVEESINNGSSKVEVHFFGGEPFYAPGVIDAAVHRTRMACGKYGLTPKFEVSTNGFFDETICRFTGNYFDTVVLSMDGPEEIQNKYRPLKGGYGSYRTVAENAYLLSKSQTELCIRVCVTEETAGNLLSITDWFCRTFHPSIITFEILQATEESERYHLSPPDPWEFAVNCVHASHIALSYGVKPVYSGAVIDKLQHSFCPVGKDNVIISSDGRVSACYLQEEEWIRRGMDLNMGRLSINGSMELEEDSIERIRKITSGYSRCENCLARWHCAGGCHVNHSYPGSSEEYDNFCIQTRIITVSRLLEELGCYKERNSLLENRKEMERMVFQKSDTQGLEGV